MAKPKPRVKLPKAVKAGETFTIKTLISHKMESGQRKDEQGEFIRRRIINKFSCTFNGEPVFACDLHPAISANPYFRFNARVAEAGTFSFTWTDDDGSVYNIERTIQVS